MNLAQKSQMRNEYRDCFANFVSYFLFFLGMAYDTRKETKAPLDPDVDKALSHAIDLQLKMHENLGKELHSIGWDVMVHF